MKPKQTLYEVFKAIQRNDTSHQQLEQHLTGIMNEYVHTYVQGVLLPSISFLIARFIRTRSSTLAKDKRPPTTTTATKVCKLLCLSLIITFCLLLHICYRLAHNSSQHRVTYYWHTFKAASRPPSIMNTLTIALASLNRSSLPKRSYEPLRRFQRINILCCYLLLIEINRNMRIGRLTKFKRRHK